MRHVLRLDNWTVSDLRSLFALADEYRAGRGLTFSGTAVLVFPPSSLRTRVAFESGAHMMGLQPIAFPPETLDKPEALVDVAGYLSEFADLAVVRHRNIAMLEGLAASDALPIINGMTDVNHPCEVLGDLYALSGEGDPIRLRYVFVGADGNIGRAWQEAARAFGLDLVQCAPAGLEIPGATATDDIEAAVACADVIITDGPGPQAEALAPYRVTAEILRAAPAGVRLNPCPPFLRGMEVSEDAIEHPAFVGYGFKRALRPVQQAIMACALGAGGAVRV